MRALVLLILSPAAIVAQTGDWALLRGINPGQTVHVHMLEGPTQSGGYVSASDAGIIVHQQTGDHAFTKDRIRKVSVRKSSKRWHNAAVGAGIGAAIGVGLAVPSLGSSNKGGFLPCFCGARFAVGLGAAFAIIGGSVAFCFPATTRSTRFHESSSAAPSRWWMLASTGRKIA